MILLGELSQAGSVKVNNVDFLRELSYRAFPALNGRVVCGLATLLLAALEDEGLRLLVSHVNADLVVNAGDWPLRDA